MRAIRLGVWMLAAAMVAGCADAGRPVAPSDVRSAAVAAEDRPAVLHRLAAGPAFAGEAAELVAGPGRAGEAVLRFADGTPFATFRVSSETLRGARLGHRALPRGRAVRIRMTRIDGERFAVEMHPAGLVFAPEAPAELTFHLRHANRGAARTLSLWKQETDGAPWEPVAAREDGGDGFRAEIGGFTKYAVASGRANEQAPGSLP